MKKLTIFCLSLVILFFMFISFGGVNASAYTFNPDWPGEDFTPYKDDIIFASVDGRGVGAGFMFWPGSGRDDVWVFIEELYDELGGTISCTFSIETDFSPLIATEIEAAWTGQFIREKYGLDGMYWNPWLQIWQLEYPVDPEEEGEFTYDEAYRKGFIDGQKSVQDAYNERFYFGMDKWLVPAIITVIVLGGIVTIAARKRREE